MTKREIYNSIMATIEKMVTDGKLNLTSETTEKSALTFKKLSELMSDAQMALELAEKEEADAAAIDKGVTPNNYVARVFIHG